MKVSVVSINLNKKQGLERTLQSLARQTCKDFEVIVVDGQSTDGSLSVYDRYGALITRRIVEHDDGIYDAWNKGISAASGDLIGLLNSGDEYHPDVVADVVEAAAAMANATGTVLCGYTLLVRDGKIVKRYPNGLYRTLLFGIGAVHPAMFVGRDVYRRVGLYEKISIASDTHFVLRCVRAGVPFVPQRYRVYMEAGGVSQRSAKLAFAQYTQALVEQRFCSPITGRALAVAYAAHKDLKALALTATALRAYRGVQRTAWSSLARLRAVITVPGIQRLILRACKYRVDRTASISPKAFILRPGNVTVGPGSVVEPSASLENGGPIVLGRECRIEAGAEVRTTQPDRSSPYGETVTLPVTLRDRAIIRPGAVVLPGSTLEEGVVVAPKAVLQGPTIPWGVYEGDPARLARANTESALRVVEPDGADSSERIRR